VSPAKQRASPAHQSIEKSYR
jgi:hypothetical protein